MSGEHLRPMPMSSYSQQGRTFRRNCRKLVTFEGLFSKTLSLIQIEMELWLSYFTMTTCSLLKGMHTFLYETTTVLNHLNLSKKYPLDKRNVNQTVNNLT